MDEDDLLQEPEELFAQDGPDLFALPDDPVEAPAPPDQQKAVPPRPKRSEEEITESLVQIVDALREPHEEISRPEAPLALYRRYRPDTFADVIGQDHVTEPLQRALVNNRVNHAYLFSGPRGCGKTTSARILARCLNCAQGPTPEPCGECQSCRDLARGGTGSLDVIEIDAASHGGVNEARDLRERAFFAPVHSRYKIYIIDEAHMVTKEGFNALLKVVEEPPPHVKFIFATTEPDKVLGTIRSRTHHYPFRLVPPKTLAHYLAELCEQEGVKVEPAVLPLVVRAGAGSVRDSLSVLDQLLGGAGEQGVTYGQATALLGYTPDTLLDEIVDAFAAGDAAGVFASIDKVIGVGQDPRRFAEDLLRRLRDLVIVSAVPDALTSGLVDVAGDQAERLSAQAKALGPGELTRAAEVIATGLTDMRGTTAPRLHLELMCARVLLPGADVNDRGLHARLDRLERRLAMVPTDGDERPTGVRTDDDASARRSAEAERTPSAEPPTPPQEAGTEQAGGERRGRRPTARPAEASAASGHGGRGDAVASETATAAGAGAEVPSAASPGPEGAPVEAVAAAGPSSEPGQAADRSRPVAVEPATPARTSSQAAPGSIDTAGMRSLWPQVLNAVKDRRRFTWILLSQNAQVLEFRDGTLTLGVGNHGVRDSFGRGGSEEVLREALLAELGLAPRIEVVVQGGSTEPPSGQGRQPQASSAQEADPAVPHTPGPPSTVRTQAMTAAKQNSKKSPAATEAEPSRDDADLDEPWEDPNELLAKHLGAELIGEEDG